MSGPTKHFLRILFILTPMIVTLLLGKLSTDASGLPQTTAFVVAVVIGAPVVAIVGLIVSTAGKKKANADAYSLWGYAGAAILMSVYAGSIVL